MGIVLKQFTGSMVTPLDDARLYEQLSSKAVGVVSGCEVTSLGANKLKVSSGWGICLGRVFSVEEETISAAVSTSGAVDGRLLIHIDVSAQSPATFVTQAQSVLPSLTKEDINSSGSVYDIPLATYTINEVSISDLKNNAPIGYIMPPNKNELDNSDFLNPVNQRNVSGTISALGYFLDRWKLVSGTAQITAAGIILNGTIVQILERAIGASFTASASAGTASYNDATRTFVLTATGQTITWAKLEKGTTKTPYVPKGYGAELAESRRYYYSFPFHYAAIHVQAAPYPTVVPVQFPVTMRISPTITFAKQWDISVTSISSEYASTGGCGISINAAAGAFMEVHYILYASADL